MGNSSGTTGGQPRGEKVNGILSDEKTLAD